ncbi:MAG: hypothetical protein AAFY57_07320 [Cyanobacteria bacterium J06642_2]
MTAPIKQLLPLSICIGIAALATHTALSPTRKPDEIVLNGFTLNGLHLNIITVNGTAPIPSTGKRLDWIDADATQATLAGRPLDHIHLAGGQLAFRIAK